MPSPRDLTRDLGRIRRGSLRSSEAPPTPSPEALPAQRSLAFDPLLGLTLLLLALGVAVQFSLILWMW